MPTFSYTPSRATAVEFEPQVDSIKFGDGYEQRSPAGLNNILGKWQLRFNAVDFTNLASIRDFFVTQGGWQSFDWTTPPPAEAIKVKCTKWGWAYDGGVFVGLDATFEQVPNI